MPDPMTPAASPWPGEPGVPLIECPPGLFMFGETLCFRSEYSACPGQPDAYVVESGEYFWGGTAGNIVKRAALLVHPCDLATTERQAEAAGAEKMREALWPMIEAGRSYAEATMGAAFAEHGARKSLLEDGTLSEEEHADAVKQNEEAQEALSDADNKLYSFFHNGDGYPIARDDLLAHVMSRRVIPLLSDALALVRAEARAEEREACAKLADMEAEAAQACIDMRLIPVAEREAKEWRFIASSIAAAIRARGDGSNG